MISILGNFQTNNFNEIFQFIILLCSILCSPLSVEYIKSTRVSLICIHTKGGMFLCKLGSIIATRQRITKQQLAITCLIMNSALLIQIRFAYMLFIRIRIIYSTGI